MRNRNLNLLDFCVLSIIFFGFFIILSYIQYEALDNTLSGNLEQINFDSRGIYISILTEIILLILAGIYLVIRRFDFSQLIIKVNIPLIWQTIGLILIAGGITHIYYSFAFAAVTEYQQLDNTTTYSVYDWISYPLVFFALLNGLFEEIFFLGLCFCVEKKWLPYVIIASLIIRFAFHTYQGIIAAIGITLFGLVFTLLRFRLPNLLPFMLAHSFFDIFGLGLFFLI